MSANAVRQGRVYVEIGADPKKLFAALGTVNKRIGQLGSSMMSVGNRLMAAGSAITAPIVGAAVAFSEVGDAVAKMAVRTGMSTEAVSALGFVAAQSGTDMGTLETGIRAMQKTLNSAALGGEAATNALQMLGVDVRELLRMSPEEQFLALADAIAAIENPGRRVALAMDIFGKAGADLLPALTQGSGGIRALMHEAEKLGIVLDADTANSASRLNDALGNLTTSFRAVTISVGAAVAPVLAGLASIVASAAANVSRYVSENKVLVQQALAIGAAFVAAGAALTAAGFAIKAVASGLSALVGPLVSTVVVASKLAKSFVSATASVVLYGIRSVAAAAASLAAWVAANAPLAITIGLLAGVAAAAINAAGGFRQVVDVLGNGFRQAGANAMVVLVDIGNTAAATFQGIFQELTAGNLIGAMDILWLGWRAGWARGSEAILGEVDSWVATFQNTWTYLGTSVATTWELMWSYAVQTGRMYGAVLQGAFNMTINGILAEWDRMEATLRKSWNWVQSFIQAGFDLAAENANVDNEMQARRQARAQQRPGVVDSMAAASAANEQTQAQTQANINAMNAAADAAAQARLDVNAERAAQRRDATRQAEQALADALEAAADRAAQRDAQAAAAGDNAAQIRGGAGAAALAMGGAEGVGTFSARAAQGMVFGKTLAQRQIDLLQEIADNTDREAAVAV